MGKYQTGKRKSKPKKLKKKHKKLKGVKYIAYKLVKYFGKKYPTYSQALPRAKELKAEMDQRGMKVGVLSIFELQRKHRVPKEIPYIDTDLTSPDDTYYFNLVNVVNGLSTKASNEIYFKSEVPGTEDLGLIQGGVEPTPGLYENYFKNFVSFIDLQRRNNLIDYSDIRVLCTEPVYDPTTKTWISRIVVTDPEGNYDQNSQLDPSVQSVIDSFESEVKYIEPSLPKLYEKKPKEKRAKGEDESVEIERIKAQKELEIERLKAQTAIEIEKEKTLQKAMEMVMQGKMTWERYDELLERLYPKK